jgi:hypothetical protein
MSYPESIGLSAAMAFCKFPEVKCSVSIVTSTFSISSLTCHIQATICTHQSTFLLIRSSYTPDVLKRHSHLHAQESTKSNHSRFSSSSLRSERFDLVHKEQELPHLLRGVDISTLHMMHISLSYKQTCDLPHATATFRHQNTL